MAARLERRANKAKERKERDQGALKQAVAVVADSEKPEASIVKCNLPMGAFTVLPVATTTGQGVRKAYLRGKGLDPSGLAALRAQAKAVEDKLSEVNATWTDERWLEPDGEPKSADLDIGIKHTVSVKDQDRMFELKMHQLLMREAIRCADEMELDEALEDTDLEERINYLEMMGTPAPEQPLFPPGEAVLSSALRFEGGRGTTAKAERERFSALRTTAEEGLQRREKSQRKDTIYKYLHDSNFMAPEGAKLEVPDKSIDEAAYLAESSRNAGLRSGPTRSETLEKYVFETDLRPPADATVAWPPEAPMLAVPPNVKKLIGAAGDGANTAPDGGVLSVHLGGAASRIGSHYWANMSSNADDVFWQFGKNDAAPSPRALFVSRESSDINGVLGVRSPCRGLLAQENTFLLDYGEQLDQGSRHIGYHMHCPFSDYGVRTNALEASIQNLLEPMPSCQGVVLHHSLTGGASTSYARWFSKYLDEMKLPTLAFQLCDNAQNTTLNGEVNQINEVLGFTKCEFTHRCLFSNHAAFAHRNYVDDQAFEGVNRLVARALTHATACLRLGAKDQDGPLAKACRVQSLSETLNHPGLNFSGLAFTERAEAKLWSPNHVFTDTLAPFSAAGARLRSVACVSGGAEIPEGALRQGDDGFLVGDVASCCPSVSSPTVCALYTAPSVGGYLTAKVKRARKIFGKMAFAHFFIGSLGSNGDVNAEAVLGELTANASQISGIEV